MTISATDVNPVLHRVADVAEAIRAEELDSPILLETIAALANREMWRQLWSVADGLSREISVLFDSELRTWVDIGTAGKVKLKPPMGAKIPFRLWVHTHPRDAYWSSTDLSTLAAYSRILKEALVLGHDHFKRTRKASESEESLEPQGPLSGWTSESILTYDEWEAAHDG